ncbi:hypothetical protein BDA99DRAFT_572392 [Phascolomyces articulosus]|uniref:Uncharacterized protein n=1 Tax=Phascolomyces articulosus TaxID=60185 RepID=A0AAD5PD75_9FUNG|nr:hypothetical protein BDA99DRAFT_572392 [Phascolomyces articulosus]
MSPHDHLSSFDTSFSDSFSEDLIRQFDHKTKAIRNALNHEHEPSTSPLPQTQQEQQHHHDQLSSLSPTIDVSSSLPSSSSQDVPNTTFDEEEQKEKVESTQHVELIEQHQEEQEQEPEQVQQEQQQPIQQPMKQKAEEEKKERKEPKLTVIVPEKQQELRPSRSRFFRSPKKMKSLSRLFTTAKEQEEQQNQQVQIQQPEESPALPKISPWSATPTSMTQTSSPSSTIFGNICQYPPKPLQYSTDISPPADNNGCPTNDNNNSNNSAHEFALKSRRSCTLKPVTPEPSEQRRSSAPALPPRSHSSRHHRMFAFFWSK